MRHQISKVLALSTLICLAFGLPSCTRSGVSGVVVTTHRLAVPQTTAFAAAALHIGPDDLGRPVDATFRPLSGRDGAALVSNEEESVRVTTLNRMEHSFFAVDDSRALAANAAAWGLHSARAGARATDRYACFRAFQIVEVREVDDAVELREPSPTAAYYVARIYYGHLYETVFSGDERGFHAGVRTDFFAASGGIEAWAQRRGLRTQVRGVGMSPRDDQAIFANTVSEVQAHYRTSREPVPIFVEYVSIPGVTIAQPQMVEWLRPRTITVDLTQIDVYDDGAPFSAAWNLRVECSVNGARVAEANAAPLFRHYRVNDRSRRGVTATYPLQWSREFELIEGDDLRCGVTGRVQRALGLLRGYQVPPSQFSYRVRPVDWTMSHLFGSGDGRVEYRIHYRIQASEQELN